MAKKTKYTATFSDGTILTRGTERTYSHAWARFYDGKMIESGFSARLDLAKKAAHTSLPTDREAAHKRKNKYRSFYAQQETLSWLKKHHGGSWDKYQESRQAILAKTRIEIVECKAL